MKIHIFFQMKIMPIILGPGRMDQHFFVFFRDGRSGWPDFVFVELQILHDNWNYSASGWWIYSNLKFEKIILWTWNFFIAMCWCISWTKRHFIRGHFNIITYKTGVINDLLGQTYPQSRQYSEHCFRLKFVLFWKVGTNGRHVQNNDHYRPWLWVGLVDQLI